MRWSIPWKIKADVRGIGTASARMLRETTHSQGNARVLPQFFFIVKEDNKNIHILFLRHNKIFEGNVTFVCFAHGIPLRSSRERRSW